MRMAGLIGLPSPLAPSLKRSCRDPGWMGGQEVAPGQSRPTHDTLTTTLPAGARRRQTVDLRTLLCSSHTGTRAFAVLGQWSFGSIWRCFWLSVWGRGAVWERHLVSRGRGGAQHPTVHRIKNDPSSASVVPKLKSLPFALAS